MKYRILAVMLFFQVMCLAQSDSVIKQPWKIQMNISYNTNFYDRNNFQPAIGLRYETNYGTFGIKTGINYTIMSNQFDLRFTCDYRLDLFRW